MSTKTLLESDQFQNYVCHALMKIRDNVLCDVTLASAKGQRVKAHKVILSAAASDASDAASSSFFRNL